MSHSEQFNDPCAQQSLPAGPPAPRPRLVFDPLVQRNPHHHPSSNVIVSLESCGDVVDSANICSAYVLGPVWSCSLRVSPLQHTGNVHSSDRPGCRQVFCCKPDRNVDAQISTFFLLFFLLDDMVILYQNLFIGQITTWNLSRHVSMYPKKYSHPAVCFSSKHVFKQFCLVIAVTTSLTSRRKWIVIENEVWWFGLKRSLSRS